MTAVRTLWILSLAVWLKASEGVAADPAATREIWGSGGSSNVFRAKWFEGEHYIHAHELWANGFYHPTLHTPRGTKGGGGSIDTNQVREVLALLPQLPPSAPPANGSHVIHIEWGAGTNRLTRSYDRANPPSVLTQLYWLSRGGFDIPVGTLGVKHEVEFKGEIATLASAGPETLFLGKGRLEAWNWKTQSDVYRLEESKLATTTQLAIYMNLDTDARISRPTSNRVAYATHQQVSLHDTQTGNLVWISPQPASWRGQEYHGGIYPVAVCLAPDAGAIAVADRQQLKLFKPALGTNAEVIATFDRGVAAMDWSADGKYIAVAGRSLDILEIMDLEKTERPDAITARNAELRQVWLMRPDGTLVGTLPQTAAVCGLAFSPDSRHLAVMDWMNDGIRIHNVETRRRESVIPIWIGQRVRRDSLPGLAWSPDGRFIAVSRSWGGVILCDVKRKIPVAVSSTAINSPMNINSPIAFSPDSSAVIARCTDGKLRFWDLEVWRGKN